jgi:hypothetical protein
MKPTGPLHPLPVSDSRGSDIAMDFIGPLPIDNGFDCILTITDHLGCDIHLVPTRCNITAEELVVIFFNNWYCENGLPLNIACNCDKLFVSRFWSSLVKLTGIKLKMSSAYHPQPNGASKRTNKMVNQLLRYHVQHNQKGWACALPRICFHLMNMLNTSTGFSNFQLHLGRTPRIIPPLIPQNIPAELQTASSSAETIINQLSNDVAEAQDNLLQAKVFQAHFANQS